MSRKDLTFRVFVSSTFSDFIAERNALQEKVFPRLRDHCRQRGARFQAIDLRWGVGQESALDQQTMTICLSELRRCQLLSPRPNFIILLGQRYGWRPLPPRIDAREFDALLARCGNSDRSRLLRWYRRDENALAPEYALLPRANEWADSTRWAAEEAHLRQVLAHAAEGGLPAGNPARRKYEESATHQEIRQGVFDTPDAADHVFAYFRTIQTLPEDETAREFRDLDERGQGDGPLADGLAAEKLAELKAQIKAALPPNHIFEYEGQWQDRAPRLELDEFCRRVERDLRDVIDREVEAFRQESDLERESRAHRQFAQERAAHFHGRQDVLGRVRRYLMDDDRLPLVVTGPPGSGKTAVLGRAWLDVPAEGGVVGLARFIGVTPPSADLRLLLAGLCAQLDAECGTAGPIPTSLTELAQAFEARLWGVPADRRVILFLDALDQLNPSDDAHSLHWLPRRELPPQVKLVLSVADAASGGHCYEALQRRHADQMIPLAPFPAADGKAVLNAWLRQAGRTLQPGQREEVLRAFAGCPYPLYLKLAFEEARRWKSYGDLPARPDGGRGLAGTISGLVTDLFRRLERPEQHGTVLPGCSLSFLAAARRGLTEEELLDALSADEQVMSDLRRRAPDSPAVARLPGVIWSRLYADLEPYLSLRSFDGVQLLSFYHRQIGDAVGTHYLGDDARRAAHAKLADYFSGQPRSLPLPQGRTPGVATRQAAVNRRVVDELPWQLACAAAGHGEGSFIERLEQVLTDLCFIEAKCLAGKVYDLVADYVRARQARAAWAGDEPCDERADRLNRYAAALAEYAVRHRPQPAPMKRRGLAVAPVLPPPPMLDAAPPGPPPEPTQLGAFAGFVSATSHLLAEYPHETIPIARHRAAQAAVAEQAETLCRTREAAWFAVDPRRNRPEEGDGCIRTLYHSAKAVAIDAAGRVAVTVGGPSHAVHFWDLGTGEPLRIAAEHHDDVAKVALTPDGRIAVTGGGTWSYGVRAGNVDGVRVLHSMMSAETGRPMTIMPDYALRVWDLSSWECVGTLHGHTDGVVALAISADGGIAVSAGVDRTLRLWDTRKGTCLRVIRNHLELIRTLALDATAGTCIAVCGKGRIHVWDVRAGDWRFLRPPPGEEFQAATVAPDGRTLHAITDRTLVVWPMGAQMPSHTYQAPEKLTQALAFAPAAGVAVTAGQKSHALMVWPLDAAEPRPHWIAGAGYCECLVVTPDGRQALTTAGGKVGFWDLTAAHPAEPETSAGLHNLGPRAVGPDGCGLVLCSSGPEKSEFAVVRPGSGYDRTPPRPGRRFVVDAKELSSADFLDSGRSLATLDGEGCLDIWDPGTGARRRRLDTAGHKTTCVAAAREADVLLTAGDDNAVRVWGPEADGARHVLRDHGDTVKSIAVTSDGRLAVTGGGKIQPIYKEPDTKGDYGVRVWDLRSGQHLRTLRGAVCQVVDLVLAPHGGAVAAVSTNGLYGQVQFWDYELGLHYGRQLISPLAFWGGLGGSVRNLDLAPDGATVAVGAFNNATKGVQIYNFRTGSLYRLPGDDCMLTRLGFIRSGRAIIAGTFGSGQLCVWDFVTSELLATCAYNLDFGNGGFRWVDDAGCCVCSDRAGGVTTLTIHNLPPRELLLDAVTADLASPNPRRRLAALWYAIDHPEVAGASGAGADRFYSAILDDVCLSDEVPEAAGVRHAAARAALRAGSGILRQTLDRIASENSWQAIGTLALILCPLTSDTDFPAVNQALCRAAEHPDLRVRKRVAVVLTRSSCPWADQLLQQMRRADDAIDELLNLVEAGVASGAALDRENGNFDLRDAEVATGLCPSSESDVKEMSQLFGEIHEYAAQSHRTLLGFSHPYLEWVFLKRRLDGTIAAENYEAAAALRDELFYLDRAHDLQGDFGKDMTSLLDRLAGLKCIAAPVKRVVAGLLRNQPDDKKAEKIEEVRRCVEFIEELETFEDFQFRELCDQLESVTEPKDLFRKLGVGAAAAEMSLGLGAPEWLAYAHVVMHDQAKLLYCLANQHVQVFPTNEAVWLIAEVFDALGYPFDASGLRERFLGADDPQGHDRKNKRGNDLGDEDADEDEQVFGSDED